ncbi:fimbrial protein [Burkholderia ubonensis]|uniref:fimbria/pilus outer membrane usher protein n=1 Tax=Burkholderia ubonensis TaxID=101571 RepID=UPI00075BE768|nr:fimbria/pilus outer membrane usher protein [Burkholderia ubonensis]KVO87715.1 fimbrial protein [Burkholderia ubonensis]KVZ57331.1 fimbrial protein [Burkholderia ubonensis]KVZ73028.1 fimbrial protein [Burkholderia ubonensis]
MRRNIVKRYTIRLQLRPLSVCVLVKSAAWFCSYASAAVETIPFAQVEFDPAFLGGGGAASGVDLSRFEGGNNANPGTYNVDIYVGTEWIGRHDVEFRAAGGLYSAQPCFDEKILRRIGLDFKKITPGRIAQISAGETCARLEEIVADASTDFDFGEQKLTVSVPQAFLLRNARGYVDPEQWDFGVPVGALGYDLNVYSSKNQGQGLDTQGYLGLNASANIGNWRFRHNGSYTWSSYGGHRYQDISTYVQRDLPSLSSQLVIGETFTSGELFDSTQFRGVRLSSDDRMLPTSQRGYAPVVRGVANSNAKVTVRQNGITIYETSVASGPFEIDDLYPTGYGGDLNVAVTEADGSVHTFSLPYAAVPMSLRPGLNRYSFVTGAVRLQESSSNPLFAQATWQRGLTNMFTGYGGLTIAEGYAAALFGGALNTSLGALGADITYARTAIPGGSRSSGSSVRISYSKSLPATNTNIALAAYRYSTNGYFALSDAMRARETVRNGKPVNAVWRQRSRASLSLNQRLGENGGNMNVTASVADYWNRPGSDASYTASYNNSFKNVTYSLSATRQRSLGGKMDTLYYMSASVPLGKTRPTTLTGSVSYDTRGQTQVQSTLSGTAGRDNTLSYSLSANRSASSNSSSTNGSGTVTYRGPVAEMNASLGANAAYQQGSFGIRGAVVVHPHGVTLSQPLSETFAIVEAKGAEGAQVATAPGVRVDSRGYAVVPYMTPYSLNSVDLDPKGLSLDVELKQTTQQVAPRAGAVPLLRFATETGRSVLMRIRTHDGAPLPFGATVYDENDKVIGSVGQAGKALVRGLNDTGALSLKWGEDSQEACVVNYELPKPHQPRGYQSLNMVCK